MIVLSVSTTSAKAYRSHRGKRIDIARKILYSNIELKFSFRRRGFCATRQQALERQVKGKNKLSNLMLCCKIILDLIPQILLIHMIGLYFTASLTKEQILWESGIIFACFTGKAVCAYLATWKAHKAAYACLLDLRLQIIRHLKKLSLGFFQERKTGDLTNIVQHDVEQVEGHLAHGLPEIMSATILPAAVFLIMLWVDWRLALVMIAGLPLMWITKKISAPLWAKNFKIFAASVTRMQEDVMEYVSNISVIKAFGKEETKTQKTTITGSKNPCPASLFRWD